jgi:TP901 family phage tail tape measure protein
VAKVEGIRAPVIIDMSDIPRSMKAIEKEFYRLKKKVGEVDFKIDDKYLREFSRKGLKPLVKDFKKVEDEAKNAAARVKVLGKAIANVRAQGKISDASFDQVAMMKGVGAKTTSAMMGYTGTRTALRDDPSNPQLQKEMEQAQARLVQLLQNARGLNQRIVESKKQQLTYTIRQGQVRNEHQAKFEAQVQREVKTFKYLVNIAKQKKATTEEIVRLHEQKNILLRRGVKLEQSEQRIIKQTAQVAKKAQASRAGLMGQGIRGRIKWFAQLRVLWGIMRAFGAIAQELMELDQAAARAMRTMVRGAEDYVRVQDKVRKTIVETARTAGTSYKEVGEALYQLSSAGLEAQDALAAVNSVVKLATLTESNMTDTTKVVAGAFNNFKDNIKGATTSTEKFMKISGTLSYVWERNQIDMNELVQGLNQSAQSAKLAGLDFGELSVILGNLGTRMIRSGRAGRMFRSAVINMAKKSTELKTAFDITFDDKKPLDFITVMDKMNVKWKDSNKTAATTKAIFDIFGKRGAPALIAMLDSWEKIKLEMGGVNNAFDLAVAQHEKLLLTQTHYKQITEVLWKNLMANISAYADFMGGVKKLLTTMNEVQIGARIARQAKRPLEDLMKTYDSAGAAMDRLVEVTAHRNLLVKQGVEESEPVIKSHEQLANNLRRVAAHYKHLEQAEEKATEKKREAALTNAGMVRGMIMANEKLEEWNIASGHQKMTLKEVNKEIKLTREELEKAKVTYAEYSELLSKDIGTMDPTVEANMKRLNTLLNKLEKRAAKIQSDKAKAAAKADREEEKRVKKARKLQKLREEAHTTAKILNAEAMKDQHVALDLKEEAELQKEEERFARLIAEHGRKEELEEEHQARMIAIQNKYSKEHANVKASEIGEAKKLYQGQYADLAYMKDNYDEYEEASTAERTQMHLKTAGTVVSATKDMFYMMAQENKKWFVYYQAMAIGEAMIGAAMAIIQVYQSLPTWAAVPVSVLVGALMAMQIAQIASQKPPEYKAGGGIMAGGSGGVTDGMAPYIVGDNPSGKELIIPSENISKDSASGYVRDSEGGGKATIINVFTEEQLADLMTQDLPKNAQINNMVRDSRERGATFNETKRVQGGG